MTRRWALAIAAICMGALGLTCPGGANAASGIRCTAGPDCDAKWVRARQWITDNSKYPIKVDTDTEISTVTRTQFRDPALIVTVNKFLRKDGTFDITLRAGCGLLFGACQPSIGEAQGSFARYVMLSSNASAPAATSPAGSAATSAATGKPKAAESSAGLQPAPGGSVPAAAGTAENPDDMLLFCRGGGPMMLHLVYPPTDSGRDVVLMAGGAVVSARSTWCAPSIAGSWRMCLCRSCLARERAIATQRVGPNRRRRPRYASEQ